MSILHFKTYCTYTYSTVHIHTHTYPTHPLSALAIGAAAAAHTAQTNCPSPGSGMSPCGEKKMRERKNTEVLPPRFAVNMPVGGVSTLKLKRSEVGGWGLEQKRGGIGRDWATINANTPKMFRTKSRKRNPKVSFVFFILFYTYIFFLI